MGSIVVYEDQIGDEERRAGMSSFGKRVRERLAAHGSSLTISDAETILRGVIDDLIAGLDENGDPGKTYILKFLTPSEPMGFDIYETQLNNNKLKLKLRDQSGDTKKLRLKISIDNLDPGPQEKRMHVAIPHKTTSGAFDYLNGIIGDVKADPPPPDENGYMVAATLFNRCQ